MPSLQALKQVDDDKDAGVCLAYMLGVRPPTALPCCRRWREGDVVCVAVDVPGRTLAVNAMGSKHEWLEFQFPIGMQLGDGLIAPAVTLLPGVKLEVMPGPTDHFRRKAPGPGFLPFLVESASPDTECPHDGA